MFEVAKSLFCIIWFWKDTAKKYVLLRKIKYIVWSELFFETER